MGGCEVPVPDPNMFQTVLEFQQGLRALLEEAGKTNGQIADESNGQISRTAIWDNTRDRLDRPATVRAVKYIVMACVPPEEADAQVELWLAARGRLAAKHGVEDEPVPEESISWWKTSIAWWTDLSVGRRLLAAGMPVVLVLAGAGWIGHHYDSDHCDTFNADLHYYRDSQIGAGHECVGVADPRRVRHGLFGPRLSNVMKLIGDQNAEAVKAGPGRYVTIAFMGPLTSDDPRVKAELEGVYTEQAKANADRDYPKIKIVLANQGSSETHWREAVAPLTKMPKTDLLAVAGLGLSQGESVSAVRALADANIPMVGDLITADGFNATGAVGDKKGKIPGLFRVPISNKDQLKAISDNLKNLGLHLPPQPKAVLVQTPVTKTDSSDLYTQSLFNSFRENPVLYSYWNALGAIQRNTYPFDPRNGNSTIKNMANLLCSGKVTPDLIYYAGREADLPTFLKQLHDEYCNNQHHLITVITGSDAAALRDPSTAWLFDQKPPILGDPNAPIRVVYVPLADPQQLNGQKGWKDFEDNFHFAHDDLNSGWAIVAYDAVMTVITAIRQTTAKGATPHPDLPKRGDIITQLGLFTEGNLLQGASGTFKLDPDTGDRHNVDPQPKPQTLPPSDPTF